MAEFRFQQGLRQCLDHVARHEASLAYLLRGQIPRPRVQADTEAGGLPGRHALRKEGGEDAGQDIAHAARGHTRIAEIALCQTPAITDQGLMAFEDTNTAVALRDILRSLGAIRLHGLGSHA